MMRHDTAALLHDPERQAPDALRPTLLLNVARRILEASAGGGALAEQVFGMIREPLGADILLNYSVAPDRTMRLVGSAGLPPSLREAAGRMQFGQTLCGGVAESREPLVVDASCDACSPAAELVRQMGLRCYACHPLLGRDGRMLGTFAVASASHDAFPPADVEFLQTVSHFLALAWDRQRGEEALRASEERHRVLLESIGDAFYALDRDWRFTYVNRQAEQLLGRSRDELLGRNVWEEFAPAVETELHPAYHRALAEGVTAAFEVFYPPHRRWYEVHAYPSPGGLSVYFRDVDERRRAAQTLQATRERLELAQQAAHIGSFEWDMRSNGLVWSPELEALYGLPPGAFAGRYDAWAAAVHPEDLAQVEQQLRAASEGGDFESEWRIVWPDGTTRWVAGRGRVFKDAAGRPLRMLGVNLDITARRQAEEELRRRERDFRALADNTPDILARFDRELRFRFVSRAVERLAGRSPREFLGRTSRELGIPQALCAAWEAALHEVFEQGRPRGVEFDCDTAEGRRHFSGQFVPEFAADGAVESVLGVVSDRTAEKAAGETLREAARRKDEFLATLAHELRNPLAPVRTGLQILRLSRPDTPAGGKALEVMERQISHMVHLIDDLLDVSRISRGLVELKRQRLALRTALDAAIEASRPLIDAGRHELTLHMPHEPLYLEADPVRLAQVVSNLLNNAARYTPDGGRIDLSVRREGREALVRVADNGVGIPREMLPRVFELFAQVDRSSAGSQGGLGIGLSIARRLAEMHHGSLEADSPGPGRGATFTLRLPLAEDLARPQGAAPQDEAPAQAPAGRRVLVVDDNTDAAESLAMMLELFGHATRTAHDGPAALAAAADFRPEVVFCDIGMPGMDGYEVARRLRADPALAHALLVAVTGWGSEEDKRLAKEAGFDFHLTKPVEVAAVQQMLAGLPA